MEKELMLEYTIDNKKCTLYKENPKYYSNAAFYKIYAGEDEQTCYADFMLKGKTRDARAFKVFNKFIKNIKFVDFEKTQPLSAGYYQMMKEYGN